MKSLNNFRRPLLLLLVALALPACTYVQEKERAVVEYVSDEDITDKVAYRILHDPALARFDISVSTLHNEVQLSGFVDSYKSRDKAERLSRGVHGVTSVVNNLVIREKGDASSRYIKKY